MVSKKTRTALAAAEPVLAEFGTPGSDLAIPGHLRWNSGEGAVMEVLPQAGSPLPSDFDAESATVHAVTADGDLLTLLESHVRSMTPWRGSTRLSSPLLALGEHTDRDELWPRVIYTTVNLGEWRAETGFRFDRRAVDSSEFQVTWSPPTRDGVELADADLVFCGRVDSSHGYMPDWSLRSWQTVVANVAEPATRADLMRQHGQPLLALTTLAADRPDALISEILFDPNTNRRVEVWTWGRKAETPDWRLPTPYLFQADALRDFPSAIRRWWRLYHQVWPAVDLFVEHVWEGRSYSPGRLLTLHTALEAYCRARYGHKDFRKLRNASGVSEEATRCSNDALALLGVSRDYLAHLRIAGRRFGRADVEAEQLHSIRRASALMQSCLLLELGFTAAEASAMLTEHYKNWPLESYSAADTSSQCGDAPTDNSSPD
jgi:hypothetical protein